MKIFVLSIIIIVVVVVMYYYPSNKNWFNKDGEYSDFPFAFKIFNKNGYEIVREVPVNENMSIVSINLKELSSTISEQLPQIQINKNFGNPEDLTSHELIKEIILDSRKFKMADVGSGVFIYVIQIPIG